MEATEAFGAALTDFLRSEIEGWDPDQVPDGESRCSGIEVYGADLELGSIDFAAASYAYEGCGDGAAVFYRIRNRIVFASAGACFECEGNATNQDFAELEAPYGNRGQVRFMADSTGVLKPVPPNAAPD